MPRATRVFPDADSFELIDDASLIEKYPSLTAVYKALKGDSVIGYTLNYAPAGYKSTIGLTIGVSSDGAITGVIVDSQSETQGVGSKITEESFLGQFTGKAASSTGLESEIDTITGATVSSSTGQKGRAVGRDRDRDRTGSDPQRRNAHGPRGRVPPEHYARRERL